MGGWKSDAELRGERGVGFIAHKVTFLTAPVVQKGLPGFGELGYFWEPGDAQILSLPPRHRHSISTCSLTQVPGFMWYKINVADHLPADPIIIAAN